jgi:lysozyme family protein
MSALWKDYFSLLMEFEGEALENNPSDPGGPTKFGIDSKSHPGVDIATLTKSGAERIYLAEFGESFAQHLPSPISFAYFDFAVNAGERQAASSLQRALGVRVDGTPGPVTINAIANMLELGEHGKLLGRLTAQRELFYLNLAHTRPKMNVFLKGWLRRAKAMNSWAAARLNDKEAA